MKDIIREGHPSLRSKAKEVVLPNEKDIQLLHDMITFLKNSQDEEKAKKYNLRSGVGLAAPQLGIEKRLIAIYFKDNEDKEHCYQLIDPRIVSHSIKNAYLPNGEGCLSVDRPVEGLVHRYARITVKAMNVAGEEVTLRLRGYAAIIVQHEIDHLDGIMFFDHIHQDNPYFVPENSDPVE